MSIFKIKTAGFQSSKKRLNLPSFAIVLIVGLWLYKRTGLVGALLAIAYLGGAIAFLFTKNLPLTTTITIQIITWIAAVIRFPELTQRLTNKINILSTEGEQ